MKEYVITIKTVCSDDWQSTYSVGVESDGEMPFEALFWAMKSLVSCTHSQLAYASNQKMRVATLAAYAVLGRDAGVMRPQ